MVKFRFNHAIAPERLNNNIIKLLFQNLYTQQTVLSIVLKQQQGYSVKIKNEVQFNKISLSKGPEQHA